MGDDARHVGGNAHAKGQRQAEIEEHNLNDKRRPADRFDVEDGDAAEEAAREVLQAR